MGRRRTAGEVEGSTPKGAAALAANLPAPHETFSDSPVLMEDERRDLAACELAIDHLRVAFWAAGKALQVIRDGRLYRETHGTFEDYLADKWDMGRSQAHRLISAWPLAERIGTSPIGDTLTESHVRALLPAARIHGEEAAAALYEALVETTGARVTATLVQEVAQGLGGDPVDAQGAAERARAHTASVPAQTVTEPPESAVRELAQQVERLRSILAVIEARETVRRAMAEDPDAARGILASLPDQAGVLKPAASPVA